MHLTLLFLLYSDSTVAGLKHLTASEEKGKKKSLQAFICMVAEVAFQEISAAALHREWAALGKYRVELEIQ